VTETSSSATSTPDAVPFAAKLLDALAASATWLERHTEAINALNVFPVPDGDTGLNLSLTLRAGVDGARTVSRETGAAVLDAAARGALMGARGNSGVILAQLLRGVARAAAGRDEIDGPLAAELLQAGADAAYDAVAEPVEGTMLTVARAAAHGAADRAQQEGVLLDVLEAAHEGAQAAVRKTPEQLAILRQAGVVDAGGEGLRVILQGLCLHLRGESMAGPAQPPAQRADLSAYQHEADAFGFCTEVLFAPARGANDGLEALRGRVASLGTSVLVVGDEELVKIHVHTMNPTGALALAAELGEIVRAKVENMRIQFEEFQAAAAAEARVREPGTSLVAIALGEGFQQIFAGLDADVVAGGQSMNPAVGDIVAAIQRCRYNHVLVLPNNRNVILAAEQAAAAVTDRSVRVVPTASMPQGIAAALAVSPAGEAEANHGAAERAARRVHTIELTRAVRPSSIDDMPVETGSWIAIVDGRTIAGPPALPGLIGQALRALPDQSYELATIYVGQDGTDAEAASLGALIGSGVGAPVEIQPGGQPHYAYIISLE
jgi:uncharacterized protein